MVSFRILEFLFRHESGVPEGQSWPTANYIRTNLFRSPKYQVGEIMNSVGSDPRSDLFGKQLEVCVRLGWIERIEDNASKRSLYRITQLGKSEYNNHVAWLIQRLETISEIMGARGSKQHDL